MGCIPACFGHWKHKQSIKNVEHQSLSSGDELQGANKVLAGSTESTKEEEIASLIKLVAQSQAEDGDEEQMSSCNREKSNEANVEDAGAFHNELLDGSLSVKMVESEIGSVEDKGEKGKEDQTHAPDAVANSGPVDFYLIDEECVAKDVHSKEKMSLYNDPKGDDGIMAYGGGCPVQMESSESLFSLSIDSRKHISAAEMGDKEVSSALKTSEKSSCEDKENMNLPEKRTGPCSKDAVTKQSGGKLKEVIAVDTSLSSWLAGSEKKPPQNTSGGSSPESEKNYGDRSILGVISPATKLKQLKGCSPDGSSPCCCSADDQPRFGTVGRFWRQTGMHSQ